jgi:trehalose-phosphatase
VSIDARLATAEPRDALLATPELAARLSASPLLVALDIDGTLAPIAPTPQDAAVPAATRRTLEQLVAVPGVHVALVTGRAARDGRQLVAVPNSWTIGNHGIELIDALGGLRVNASAETYAPTIARADELLREPLNGFEGVFVENKKWTLSVHFRLAQEAAAPHVRDIVSDVARRLGLRMFEGKKIFELRPPVAITKGTALLDLATTLGVVVKGALHGSILYAGDDRTDEDAFESLRALRSSAITIHVGTAILPDGARTSAEFLVRDPTALHNLLDWLATERATRAVPRT